MKYILILFLLLSSNCYAYRIPKPVPFNEVDKNSIVELNNVLEKLWDITNGRYNLNIVTTNPDGATSGDVGDMILLNDDGTFYFEINVDGGTVWKGVLLQDLP